MRNVKVYIVIHSTGNTNGFILTMRNVKLWIKDVNEDGSLVLY